MSGYNWVTKDRSRLGENEPGSSPASPPPSQLGLFEIVVRLAFFCNLASPISQEEPWLLGAIPHGCGCHYVPLTPP
jgi:hypothetical protein